MVLLGYIPPGIVLRYGTGLKTQIKTFYFKHQMYNYRGVVRGTEREGRGCFVQQPETQHTHSPPGPAFRGSLSEEDWMTCTHGSVASRTRGAVCLCRYRNMAGAVHPRLRCGATSVTTCLLLLHDTAASRVSLLFHRGSVHLRGAPCLCCGLSHNLCVVCNVCS